MFPANDVISNLVGHCIALHQAHDLVAMIWLSMYPYQWLLLTLRPLVIKMKTISTGFFPKATMRVLLEAHHSVAIEKLAS